MFNFGPYELQYQGRRYFGNVSLAEHHVFQRGDTFYIFNVADHSASRVPAWLAELCAEASADLSRLFPAVAVAELRQRGLIADAACRERSRVADEGAGGRGPIVNLALFLAQECNMRCTYCYGDGGSYAGDGLMSDATAIAAVEWLLANSGDAPIVKIGFFGGEPFMNFRLMKRIVFYAREQAASLGKQVRFNVTTNGTLLDDEKIAFLAREQIDVQVSFDGPPDYQNRHRPLANGRDSHAEVLRNVTRLRVVVPDVAARATLWQDADPQRMMGAMEQAGFATYSIVKASPVLLSSKSSDAPASDADASAQVVNYYRAAAQRMLDAIRSRSLEHGPLPNLLQALLDIDGRRGRDYGCGIGKDMVAVAVNGDIYPCHRFVGIEGLCSGNVVSRPDGLPGGYWDANVDSMAECSGCWARYLCGGGCSYHNKAHTGDMQEPASSYCLETKVLFEELLSVYCELDESDKRYLRRVARRKRNARAKMAPQPGDLR